MNVATLRELQSKFKQPKSQEEFEEIMEYIQSSGINIANLYQELEMSSAYANIHRDVSYKRTSISLHSHSFYEVIFCRAADRVEYLIGTRHYRVSAGDIMIVAPGVGHTPILPEDMQYPYERDIMWLSCTFLDEIIKLFPESRIGKMRDALLFRTKGTPYGYIGDFFAEGVRETVDQKTCYDMIIPAQAILIISHILRALAEGKGKEFQPEKPTLINALIEYIEGHLDERLNLDEVAASFYISRGTVNKLFHQSLDTTFYKFVTQRRLILAKVLMSEGESLDLISSKCGFADYSTFYKAFKKEYGISPREYMKI